MTLLCLTLVSFPLSLSCCLSLPVYWCFHLYSLDYIDYFSVTSRLSYHYPPSWFQWFLPSSYNDPIFLSSIICFYFLTMLTVVLHVCTHTHTHTHTHTKKNTVKFRYSYYMYFNNRFVKKVNWGLFKLWWQLSLGCYRNYKSRLQIAHLWFIYKIISTSNKCVVRFSLFCLKYWSWQNQMSTVITQIINELCAWNNEIYAHLVSSISHVHI